MNLQRRWWRFAIAPLAIWFGVAACSMDYVIGGEAGAHGQTPEARAELKAEYVKRAEAHIARGEFRHAAAAYTKAIQIDPADSRLYDARGNAYAHMGDAQAARNDYRKTIELSQTVSADPAPAGKSADPAPAGKSADPAPAGKSAAPAPAGRLADPARQAAAPSPIQLTQAEETEESEQVEGQQADPMPEDMPVPTPQIPQPDPESPATPQATVPFSEILASRISASSPVGTTISPTAAAQTTPATTADLLQSAPSVTVRRTSALNLDPRVRGFRSSQINASANGMTQIKTRIDIDSVFSGIDPGIVSNLEVIDGPYTSLWGPGFAFLVADLFPTERYDAPTLHGSTTFNQGVNGRSIYTRENVWGGGQDWGFYASIGLRTGNDYHAGRNSNDFRIPASFHQWDAYMGLGVDLTSTSRLEFNYIRVERNNIELPGVVYDLTQSRDEQFNIRYVVQEDREDPERFVLQYWHGRTPYHGDAGRDSKQQTFYQPYITDVFRGFTPPFDSFNLSNTFAQGVSTNSGVRSALTWGDRDDVQLTVGADWRRYEQSYVESHISPFGAPTVIFGDNFFGIPSSSMDDYGLFAHLTMPINNWFDVSVGARGDRTIAFVGDDIVNAGGTLAGTDEPREWLGMTYATAQVKMTDNWSMTGGVSYAMRNPTLAELYSDSPFVPLIRQGNAIIDGDSELNPERNTQFDLGVTGQWDNVLVGVRAFHSNIDNYILYNFIQNAGNPAVDEEFASRAYQYANLDRATLFGGDMFAELRLLPWLSTNMNMAYVKGTNHSPQENLGPDATVGAAPRSGSAEALPGIYPFNTVWGVRLHDPCIERDRWGVELLTRMVIGQGYVAESLFEDPTPGYTMLALRGYYRVNENLRLTSMIQNLTDRTYTEHGSLVIIDVDGNRSFVKEPGISWFTGFELQY